MSDMKCVKCNSNLEQIADFYTCTNPHCTLCGDKDMWQELICTRKALDVAVDALDAGRTLARIAGFEMLATGMDEAVEKITALEQKDK